ncbi:hypothetical protein ACWDYH_00455 [Nocardia goodfellowii]
MTDILEDFKRVRDYLNRVDGSVPPSISAKISRLEELAKLGDMEKVREAFEAGQKASSWYGSEVSFDTIHPRLAAFFKAFYDAASKMYTPEGLLMWRTTDEIPADVEKVRDVDGDIWYRSDWRRWDTNDLYAPYTEVPRNN